MSSQLPKRSLPIQKYFISPHLPSSPQFSSQSTPNFLNPPAPNPPNSSLKQQQKQMKKYLQSNFSRFNINQLKTFHKSLLQYAKGDIKLLKKGMVVVMNMFGILIEEDKLDKVILQLKSTTTHQQGKTYHIDKAKKNIKKKTKINHNQQLQKINLQHQNNQLKSIKSSTQLTIPHNKKTITIDQQQHHKKTKQIHNNFLQIVHFDKFLQLYRIIQTHYFKQTIIDYLSIMLQGSFPNFCHQISSSKVNNKINKKGKCQGIIDQSSTFISDQKQQQQIGYTDIYQAFFRRSTQEKAQKIAKMFQSKIKQHCKQHVKSTYYSSKQKQPSPNNSIKDQDSNYNIKQDWKIKIQQLYNLCYYDYELCQTIYEHFMKDRFQNQNHSLDQKSSFKLINSDSDDNKNIRMSVLNQVNVQKNTKDKYSQLFQKQNL